MDLWQNACNELEKLQEIERVCSVFFCLRFLQSYTNKFSCCSLKRGKHAFYLLQEKDGELKGRTRAMTSLQVILSVVPYKGVMSC